MQITTDHIKALFKKHNIINNDTQYLIRMQFHARKYFIRLGYGREVTYVFKGADRSYYCFEDDLRRLLVMMSAGVCP